MNNPNLAPRDRWEKMLEEYNDIVRVLMVADWAYGAFAILASQGDEDAKKYQLLSDKAIMKARDLNPRLEIFLKDIKG